MAKPRADRKAQGSKPKTTKAKSTRAKTKPAAGKKPSAKTARASKPASGRDWKAEAAKEEVQEIVRRYIGRPSKYDPAFCPMVIAWGRLGKSKTWMSAELMVLVETMNDWARQHPEFSDALRIAKALEQQHWEDLGQDNARSMGFQQSMWSRSMAARFPKDWRESKELTGPEGGVIQIQMVA